MKNLDYYIWKDGASTYLAEANGTTATKDYTSGISLDDLFNTHVFPDMPSAGWTFGFAGQKLSVNNPITLPQSPSFFQTCIGLHGIFTGHWSVGGTVIETTSSFPTNKAIFESISVPGTNTGLGIDMSGIKGRNAFPDQGAGTGTELNVSLLKYESDSLSQDILHLRNIGGQYMYRGLHLVGLVSGSKIENVFFRSDSSTYLGDIDLIIEQADRDVPANVHSDRPSFNFVRNFHTRHLSGFGGNTGFMKGFMYLKGKYNKFDNLMADNGRYDDSMIRFDEAWSNTINGIRTMDFNYVTPNTESIIVFNSNHATNTSQQSYDNHIADARLSESVYPYTLKYTGGAHRNTVEMTYYNSTINIDDLGAGTVGNLVRVLDGHGSPTATMPPVSTTADIIRVEDLRDGATRHGSDTIAQNTISKTISHGLFNTPERIRLMPTSHKFTDWFISAKDATDFTISLTKPTLHAISFDWEATVNK